MKARNVLILVATAVFLLTALGLLWLVDDLLKNEALRVAEEEARIVLERNLAVHSYFAHELKPSVFKLLDKNPDPSYFEPAWMSSTYAIRKIDQHYRRLAKGDYYYKECAINARSPQNEADAFERAFIEEMKARPELEARSTIRVIDGQPYFVFMRRGESMEQSCLRCHSQPELAPKDMVEQYGPARSFQRQEGELVSAISIRVPLGLALAKKRQFAIKLSVLLLAGLAGMIVFVLLLHRRLFQTPLEVIGRQTRALADDPGKLGQQIPPRHLQEWNALIQDFNRMSTNLKTARDHLEERVWLRTSQLLEVNRKLELEMAQRKQAADELRQREETYRELVAGLPDIVMRFDRQGRHLFVSESVQETVGIPAARFIDKTHRELGFPEELCRFWAQAIEKVFASGQNFETEFSVEGKNGPIIFNWRLLPERDEQGAVKSVLSLSRDITAHRRAEEAYRTLFNEMLDGFALHEIIQDAAGQPVDYRFLAVNPAFERMTGLTAREVVGHTVLEVLPGTERHWIETYGRVALTGEPAVFENYAAELDKYFDVTAFRPASNQFACIFADITQRRRAETALRESEEKLRGIFDTMNAGIILVDATGKIIFANRRMAEMFGLQLDALIDSAYLEHTHPSESAEADQKMRQLIDGAIDFVFLERLYQRQDGSTFWGQLSGRRLFRPDGSFWALVGVIHDVTERRLAQQERDRLELQLRQAQKMQAIGTLAGGIAHDFNNILGVVLGFAEIAHDDAMSGKVNPADIEQIMASAQRAKELVRQILAFSRKRNLDLKPIDLNRAVLKAQDILGRTLPKMIAIKADLASGLPAIQADPIQIEQVLLNLASNAQDAMPQGGALTFTTRKITLDQDDQRRHMEIVPGSYLLLEVTDTGAGMDKDTVEHIYEPFYTTKDIGKGTGLGLSTVYGIVKGHGGHILCLSEPGKGSTFQIYLPVLHDDGPPAAAEEDRRQNDPSTAGAETILLVDDEEALRRIGVKALESQGYRVLTAASGEEAVEKFMAEQAGVDLVVMDLGMPGMGGHKAMEIILGLAPRAKLVIASGYASGDQVRAALDAGAAGYVAKPFRRDELLATVRGVLDRG